MRNAILCKNKMNEKCNNINLKYIKLYFRNGCFLRPSVFAPNMQHKYGRDEQKRHY